MNTLEAPLQHILDSVSGAAAVALLGLDGMPVAAVGARRDVPIDLIAASYADLVRRANRCADECGMAGTLEMVISSERATVLLRVVTADYGVVVVLEPGGSYGRARYEMHKASLALVDELAA